jgi:hypothetical protein
LGLDLRDAPSALGIINPKTRPHSGKNILETSPKFSMSALDDIHNIHHSFQTPDAMARIQQAREENEDEEMEDIDKDEMQSTNNPQRYASRKARYGLTPMLDLPFIPRPKFSKIKERKALFFLSYFYSNFYSFQNSYGHNEFYLLTEPILSNQTEVQSWNQK